MPQAEAEGARDTGAFMAEHHGMIVTSTGLIFIAASDGKIRALDEGTGKVLWTATLPAGSEGIPAMYMAMAGNTWLFQRHRISTQAAGTQERRHTEEGAFRSA